LTQQTTFDPVTLEILWHRLTTIADECWSTVRRTAFSPIITEALDIGCEVMDARGRTLAHATRGMPVFNLVLPNVVGAFLSQFGASWIEEGDVLITNDPWLCAGHLPDIAVINPVFHHATLLGFVGNIANATDIGGTLARSAAREVYEEGLQIPPMKLFRRGVANEDLFRMVRANVREADSVVGDLEAQVAANAAAGARLRDFVDEYGFAELNSLCDTIQAYSERGMRAAIAALPDGIYRAALDADGADTPIRLEIAVDVRGDGIEVTFPNCPPQVAQGGINVAMNYTRAHTCYILQCVLAPEIPSNQGSFRPISVSAPEGSILNARYPASVGLRTKTGWHVHPLILTAMADVAADRVMAPGGMPSWLVISGTDVAQRSFREHMVVSGGLGATENADGQAACGFPTTTASVPTEVIETRSPVLIEAKEYIPDSGGAGRMRGGLGQRIVVRARPGAVEQLVLSASLDRVRVPAEGLHGGRPGQRSRFAVRAASGQETEVASGYAVLHSDADALVLEVAGGGGFGAPDQRARELIEHDRVFGYVEAEELHTA
jgi:N-methylhydantoinase B/oxoprolinase/acetone carboxylase alpha subunit